MTPDKSEEIVNWMGRRFRDAVFINYEPVCHVATYET